jgi:hypothetical protein
MEKMAAFLVPLPFHFMIVPPVLMLAIACVRAFAVSDIRWYLIDRSFYRPLGVTALLLN